MAPEEKRLLIKVLCEMFPYGVNILADIDKEFDGGAIGELLGIVPHTGIEGELLFYQKGCLTPLSIEEIRPYLRPMSSMTEEEKKELKHEHIKDEKLYAECLTKTANGDDSMRGKVIPHFAADWCNKNHFDFRGLIPMGLALEAPEDMYKTE